MADILLQVAGRSYSVSAREGDMAHLRKLEALIGRHADAAQRAAGNASGERALLYLALILADALDEAESKPSHGVSQALLERIAERLETIAGALEEEVALPLEQVDATA